MKQVEKVRLVCNGCDKEYFVHPYRKDTSRYCGNKCIGRLYACKTCETQFYRKQYKARTNDIFCSHKCQVANKFYKGHQPYVDNTGSNSYAWKGDKVGYFALHNWVSRNLGRPKKCEHCGSEDAIKYEWANKSHEYRRDLADWIRLCVPCHNIYDDTANRAKKTKLERYGKEAYTNAVTKSWITRRLNAKTSF